jgi:hypothetical protein
MLLAAATRRTLQYIVVFGALAFTATCGADVGPPDEQAPDGSKPAGAFGIAAESGPSEESITISWSPVANAQTYALYFSTIPGVTPQTGQRIVGAPTSFVHTQLTPGASYYYIVAGINGDFEGPQSNEVSATPRAGVGIHVETPGAGDLIDTSVPFVVDVSTSQAVSSVVASLGTTNTPLAFDAAIGRWTGTLTVGPLASPSAQEIRLTALASGGGTAKADLIVRLDHPPVLLVASPADQAAASPSVRITATCVDDFRTGCASLIAYVEGSRSSPLASGVNSIDETVSLAQFGNGVVHLVIEGTDSAGQTTIVRRDVLRQ